MDSSKICSPESEHHTRSKRGESPAIIGAFLKGAHALRRRRTPHHDGPNSHMLVDRVQGQWSSGSSSISSILVPAKEQIQDTGELIEGHVVEETRGDCVQLPPTSSFANVVSVEAWISTPKSTMRDQHVHRQTKIHMDKKVAPSPLPHIASMMVKKRTMEESSLKNICDLTKVMQPSSWVSIGHQSQMNHTQGLEEAIQSPKRVCHKPHNNAQPVTEDLIHGLHKQDVINFSIQSPNIPLSGHLITHKNKETRVAKGLQDIMGISTGMAGTVSKLHSSARSSRRRLYVCSTCGMAFPTGQALGGHVGHHSSRKLLSSKRYGERPRGQVASSFAGVLLSPGTAIPITTASVQGSSHPGAFSALNKDEVKPQVMSGAHHNSINKGFRLFGVDIVGVPKEETMN
uniref:C2H2-type domain-containing protein n=1 Tax=Oryza brachyantha TaxID=4533 RepID=J3N6W1_ORYBR